MKSQIGSVIIYGLVDSKEPERIKYVGKTHQKVNKRIHDHIRESYKLKTKKDYWIQSVLSNLGDINIKIIEICDQTNWLEKEKYWISRLDDLTNTSKGGDGGRGLKSTMTYEELRNFAHVYMKYVNNSKSWIKFVIDNPQYKIPKYPYASYKNRGWVGWHDLLLNYSGNDNKRNTYKKLFTYSESKKRLSKLNIKNKKEFKKLSKTLQIGIPTQPDTFYKKRNEWISWGNFLSNDNKFHKNKEFLSYKNARDKIKHIGLASAKEYRKYIQTSDLILPFEPDRFYKRRNEWINWKDFLSKKRIK